METSEAGMAEEGDNARRTRDGIADLANNEGSAGGSGRLSAQHRVRRMGSSPRPAIAPPVGRTPWEHM
ncbi:MAG: hypothetical protein U0575_06820 [Phycisphaerales bacterium]